MPFGILKRLNRYIKSANWLFFDRLVKMVVSFLVSVHVIRHLGPSEYGKFNYLLALTTFVVPAFKLGLDIIVVKKFIQEDHDKNIIFGTSLILNILAYAVVFLLFLLSIGLFSQNSEYNTLLIIILIGNFFYIFDIFEKYFDAKILGKYVFYANIAALCISSSIRIFLVYIAADLIWFCWVLTLELAVRSLVLSFFSRKFDINFLKFQFDITVASELLKEAWPFIFTGMIGVLLYKADQVMIHYYLGSREVGLYSVASKLTLLVCVVPVILCTVFFPAIVAAKELSETLFEKRVIGLYSGLFLISVVFSLFLSQVNELLIVTLFGPEFLEAVQIFNVYVWLIIFIFLNEGQWKWYLIMGYQKLAFKRLVIGLILNILTNVVAISKFGTIGAAYATLISYFYITILSNLIHETLRINFKLLCRAILNPISGLKNSLGV